MADQKARGGDMTEPSIEAQLEALRDENAELRAQLDAASAQAESAGNRARSIVSWILAVLAVIAVLAGAHAAWLQTTIADEERFVATFAPLPRDEAIATALSNRIANELIVESQVGTVVEQNLPPNLAFIAVPVTEGLRTLTADVAGELIRSDLFAGIWSEALRLSHNAASVVLSTNGRVTLDLNQAADEVVARLEARGVTLLSDVEVELPEIVIFQNDQLEAASGIVDGIDTMGWWLPVLALLLFVAAIWVAPDRRWMTSVVAFGSAIALLLVLVVVRLTRAGTVSSIDDETTRAAAEAVWDTTLRFYRQSMWALIVLAVIVGLAAWVFGSSSKAESTRTWWNEMIERRRGPGATAPTAGFAGFVAGWRRAIQGGLIVIGLLFILIVPDPSAFLVVITALAVLGLIGAVEIVGGPIGSDDHTVMSAEAMADAPADSTSTEN